MENRGSKFRKWDLHIHSPYTYLNNNFIKNKDGSPNIESFIEKIKGESIEVIGLTNYFNFKEEDFSLQKELEKQGITTFLNLEIRISNINKSDELMDYHIIFSNELDKKIIVNLLGELRANLGCSHKTFNMLSKDEIENKASISIEALHDVLKKNKDLNGKYLTGFLSRGHGSATSDNDPKNAAIYENICRNSDFLIHSSCNDGTTCNDKKCNHSNIDKDRYFWLNTSKYKRPLLQSSDSHTIDQIGSKYSWIKADKTFEGLRQVKFEPELRICLDKELYIKKDELTIDRVEMNGKKLYLSENMNAIIGGRSAGKSTLLNSIAKKFNNKNYSDKFNIFENMENFKVFWNDGKEDYSREIEYIPQEYMYEISNDRQKINDFITDIISRNNKLEMVDEYKNKCLLIENEILALLSNYRNINNNFSSLIKPEFEKESIKKRLTQYNLKKDEILESDYIEDFKKNEYFNLVKKLDSIEKELIDLNSYIEKINNLRVINANIEGLQDLEEDVKKNFEEFLEKINENFNMKFNEKLSEQLINFYEKRNTLQKNKEDIINSSLYKKGKIFEDNNKELQEINKHIEEENKNLKEIEDFEIEKKNLDETIEIIKCKLIEQYKKYTEVRNEFKNSFVIEEEDMEITVDFRIIDLEEEFEYISGKGTAKNDFLEKLQKDLDAYITGIFDDNTLKFNKNKNKLDHIEKVFSKQFYNEFYEIKYQNDNFSEMSPGKKSFVILKLILDFSMRKAPVLIDQPEDNLDNKTIYNDLTKYLRQTKQRRQIILVSHNPNAVVGADCENIIIANQHSEQEKNRNSIRFDYTNGALENNTVNSEYNDFILENYSIREHVCKILEGGEEAFLEREQKYGIG